MWCLTLSRMNTIFISSWRLYLRRPICLCCGSVKGDIVGYGRDMQIFMDTPMYGKRVGLHINRRRMKCRDCNSTFLEPLREHA